MKNKAGAGEEADGIEEGKGREEREVQEEGGGRVGVRL